MYPYGTSVEILSSSDGWYHVSVDGKTGYMFGKYVTVSDEGGSDAVKKLGRSGPALINSVNTGTVNVSAVNLRERATTESPVITVISKGKSVTVLDTENDWYKVTFDGKPGYIFGEYLDVEYVESSSEEIKVYVSGGAVNFREGPSSSSNVITVLGRGTALALVEDGDTWIKAVYNGYTGYISSDYVTYEAPVSVSSSAASDSLGEQIVAKAEEYLGTPYVYGGASPSGFDCSGFTSYIFSLFDISINRTADYQVFNGTSVSVEELKPGDLVFFSEGNTGYASHVGIYAGGGQFIHSANGGVKYNYLSDPYYSDYYLCAVRVL